MFSKFRSQKIVNTSTLEYRAPSSIFRYSRVNNEI